MASNNTADSQNEALEQEAVSAPLRAESDPVRELQSLLGGVAETVLEASDEDLLSESREQGNDPRQEAEEVRAILLDALKGIPAEPKRTP